MAGWLGGRDGWMDGGDMGDWAITWGACLLACCCLLLLLFFVLGGCEGMAWVKIRGFVLKLLLLLLLFAHIITMEALFAVADAAAVGEWGGIGLGFRFVLLSWVWLFSYFLFFVVWFYFGCVYD
ncbi:uncharacterized protein K452DRAFT_52313 [Aplosporella prunicola CBS 121167]|uniref:Uncharacterized protein n=1 Tax=Aplosporella prunicola CBS 121167 TaxID=1176127 RepID=A0A6A6B8D1_9PEZI|nr:uncharacterized protein K452DRAFT_52313 [Aplosporella prunicola CBS 121167]KAF2140176.1 hypothetical protein K452DRAFT_52313 [Aplosporella prunicola CBS 121167]